MVRSVRNPYSLDILKGDVYWDDWSYSGIQKVNKNTGQNRQRVINWVYRPTALRAMWNGKQSKGKYTLLTYLRIFPMFQKQKNECSTIVDRIKLRHVFLRLNHQCMRLETTITCAAMFIFVF